MNELVHIKGKDIFTNTFIIADGTENKHKNVKELILKYEKQLKSFGTLAVLNGESTGGRPEQYYDLNEMQATFLITLLRNNDVVVNFKLELVKEFYRMRCFILEKQTAEWQQTRLQSKQVRLQETDAIKELVEYAKSQGSQNADMLYMNYSKLVKQLAGYDKRDAADTDALMMIIAFERGLFGIISSEMMVDTPYKNIYRKAKQELTQLKLYWTRPALHNSNQAAIV